MQVANVLCVHLLEYLEDELLLPLLSPWLRALLPRLAVLRPLLLQLLLRGDIELATRGSAALLDTCRVLARRSLVTAEAACWRPWRLWRSCWSHSSSEDTGREEETERGMETPRPGTPLTPAQSPLVSAVRLQCTMAPHSPHSPWPAPPCPDCPSLLLLQAGGCSPVRCFSHLTWAQDMLENWKTLQTLKNI